MLELPSGIKKLKIERRLRHKFRLLHTQSCNLTMRLRLGRIEWPVPVRCSWRMNGWNEECERAMMWLCLSPDI